jgi:hypothetical protein
MKMSTKDMATSLLLGVMIGIATCVATFFFLKWIVGVASKIYYGKALARQPQMPTMELGVDQSSARLTPLQLTAAVDTHAMTKITSAAL